MGGKAVNRQQAKILRQVRPCIAGLVRDLQQIRPFRNGESPAAWVDWWLGHAEGLYPVLRTYSKVWLVPCLELVQVLHGAVRQTYHPRLADLTGSIVEAGWAPGLESLAISSACALVRPYMTQGTSSPELTRTVGNLVAAFRQVTKDSNIQKTAVNGNSANQPGKAKPRKNRKKRRGMSPVVWSLTHPLPGSFGTGKGR